jgi:predicted XRE-type DNA-binding protein
MFERVNISDLKLDNAIWPRSSLDEEAIERYRDCLGELPPISADRQTKVVLDGWHRIEAHKLEGETTIAVEFEDCPAHLLMARAYALNARHGLPVANDVRDRIILDLRQGKNGHDPLTEKEIAQVMGLSQQRVNQVLVNLLGASSFTSDKHKVKEAIRLYLQGVSHRKIGEQFGVSHPTISSVIREYVKRKDLIAEHLKRRGYLKSLLSYPDRGPWGDAKYPGNTSGYLLVDLIDYYQPRSILDPMEGSGTTGDVAFDMADIPYAGLDLRSGFDLVSEELDGEYDFIFWHPPYHDAVDYDVAHPNNLSRCTSLDAHLDKLKLCLSKLLDHLRPAGHLCLLCADLRKAGVILPIHSAIINFNVAPIEAVLIKQIEGRSRYFDYGNAPFIPIIHEYVLVFRKDGAAASDTNN